MYREIGCGFIESVYQESMTRNYQPKATVEPDCAMKFFVYFVDNA